MKRLKKYIPMSVKGWVVYFAAMAVASAICMMLRTVSNTDVHVPLIFVLAVQAGRLRRRG